MFGRSVTDRPAVPGLQAQVSRRAVLGGLASLAVLFGTPSLAFADTPAPKSTPFGTPRPNHTSFRDANGNLIQPTPYAVQASCALTEDYFLTADVLVGANDQVVPFVNHLNGGAVEAVVVTEASGALSHVHRDPSSTSGWTITPIQYPTALGSVAQVAVAASPKGVFIGTVAPPDPHTNNSTLSWFSWLTDATTWATGSVMGPGAPLEMLRSGVAPDQTPYFYGWVGSPTTINKVLNFTFTFFAYLCTGQAAPQMRPVLELDYPASTQPNIPDAVLLYDVNDTGAAVHGVAAVLQTTTDSSTVSVYPQSGTTYSSTVLTPSEGATALLWANTPGPNQWELLYSSAGDVTYVDQSGPTSLFGFGSDLNYGDVAAWVNEGAYTFNVLADGVVSVMSQASAGGAFALPIPLTEGVERIYSAITDPAQSTLFTVLADTTLAVLTKDPTSGSWTQHQVHHDTPEMQEVESYQTMISILDANGVGVAGAQATIATDRLVGIWQEPSGNAVIEPGTPVTLTADLDGKITVSIPAEELDCAVLTVQALDSSNNPTGDPFLVTPHTDLANFLAGQGSLIDVPQLSGDALQNAKTASGASLFANLGGASGGAAAASAINHMGSLGLGSQPAQLGGTQSAMFDLTGSTPAFQASSNPNAYSLDVDALNAKRRRDAAHLGHPKRHPHPVGDVGGISDWWNSVKHDAETAFHGLRHAAITVKKMVTSWAADTKQWTVNLIVDIGDGLDSLMTYIVKDVKTAVHAISAFFHALGADIKSVIDWLKHHVLDLLKEADGNAKIMMGWFTTAIGTTASPGPFYAALATVKATVDGDLAKVGTEVADAIQEMKDAVGDATFGSAAELPGLVAYTGSQELEPIAKDAREVVKILQHSPANWLLNKIKKYWPSDDPGPTSVSAFGPVVDDLAADFKDLVDVADSIVNLLHVSASTMFSSSQAYGGATIAAWLDALNSTVAATIQLLQAISDTLMDMLHAAFDALLDTLNYEIRTGGSSLIEQIFGQANLGPSSQITVGRLVTLVAAYPATLAAGDNALFPPPGSTSRSRSGKKNAKDRRLGDGNDSWETGLGITAAVVQGIWGLNDIVVDLQTGTDPDGSKREVPGICDWIDIVAPMLLTILQWPSAKGPNNATEYPFYGGADTSTKWDWMLPFIIISGLAPACMGLYQKRTPAGAGTKLPAPHNVDSPFANYYGPVVQMISGIVNTAIGTSFNAKTSAGGASIAAGVLGNLSYMLAVLAQKYVNEAAEDGPVLIKTVVDGAGNLGAAICIAEATSIPPK